MIDPVFFLTTKRPLGIRGFRAKKNAPYYFQNHSLYNSLMDKSVTNPSLFVVKKNTVLDIVPFNCTGI
jgi:hypothetical protein